MRLYRFLSLCVASIATCDGEPRTPASIARDSAGIRIVENHAPAWTTTEDWRLDSIPELDVGPAELLSEVGSTYRLEDGRLVVAHNSVPEILLYSREGRLITRVGRRGSGPGEFADISRMFLTPDRDSIVINDFNQNRITVFDTQGMLVGTTPSSAGGARLFIDGMFDDGSFLVATTAPPTPEVRGLVRPERMLLRRARDGQETRLARIPGTPRFYQEMPDGTVDFRSPFFAHSTHYATWGDRVVWAATDTFQLHVHALDGTLTSLIRSPYTSRFVTEADVQPLIEQRVSSLADENLHALVRRTLGSMPRGTFPAFGAADGLGASMHVDDDGHLWVAAYAMPGVARNDRLIFDRDGVWLGTVTLPPRFAPRHIGSDFIVGRSRDSLDIEHVQLYRLRRSR